MSTLVQPNNTSLLVVDGASMTAKVHDQEVSKLLYHSKTGSFGYPAAAAVHQHRLEEVCLARRLRRIQRRLLLQYVAGTEKTKTITTIDCLSIATESTASIDSEEEAIYEIDSS